MSDLASQLEKITMAHAFLDWVDRSLTVAHASLAKDPCLAVTAIFQTWLQWFKTTGSGVEWPELATVERECCQLYEQYKGKEWVCPFNVHFALVDPSLEFLMDDLTVEMMVSAPVVASTSNTAKHPVGVLVVVRGEGWSKGRRGEEAANCGDIQEAGPLTPKAVVGGIARGLATTLRSKGKGKGKARDEEDEDIEEQIEEFATTAGPIMTQRAAGTPWGSSPVIVVTAQGKAARTVDGLTSEEGEGDMEMRETTPLAMVAKVEQEVSNMEVKGEEEFEAAPAAIKEEEEKERAEEGTWSDTPLHQVGNNKLEWLGKDLGWPMLLMSAASLADFDKRVAGVEWQFQRELKAAREELLAVQACYTVAKQTLVTLVGYRRDCQAFLAWQEENNIGEGNWEEAEDLVEVPNDNADLDS
ncbi:hypothetical protein C0989_005607 [Termitomyces sp. Mn162]|nr:hypothetical protein C0989_005607 [Termitomyces sp. Mn162]